MMDAASAESEAHSSLTRHEEIHCHKARIFSLLASRPVVRAWKNAICDGAVYLGKGHFPMSYADRYFRMSREDISYVTFSIVTAFKEVVCNFEGQEIERSQCHVSPAQCEASEFLIVTFSNDHDTVAILPHRVYSRMQGDESTSPNEALPDVIPASTISDYAFSVTLLLANIDEIKRITRFPMHATTTPSQIGLDGLIPTAGTPENIMPQLSVTKTTESEISTIQAFDEQEERTLRTLHRQFPKWTPMTINFLDYQPLLRDFKIVVPDCDRHPHGFEAVICHQFGRSYTGSNSDNSPYHKYADYYLTHGIITNPDVALFVPRRLVSELPGHGTMRMELYDHDRPVNRKKFMFEKDEAGRWAKDVWRIIGEYPPNENPTPAEKQREIWRKAFPWPELKAQAPLPGDWMLPKAREARGDKHEPRSKHDSGTGDEVAVKPSDVSLTLTHYFEKAGI